VGGGRIELEQRTSWFDRVPVTLLGDAQAVSLAETTALGLDGGVGALCELPA
jgi:hypothetical protein